MKRRVSMECEADLGHLPIEVGQRVYADFHHPATGALEAKANGYVLAIEELPEPPIMTAEDVIAEIELLVRHDKDKSGDLCAEACRGIEQLIARYRAQETKP